MRSGSGGAPTFSANRCYFTSYPVGSKHCIAAACSVTNPDSATPACTAAGYLNFASTGTVFGTYPCGEITEIYPAAATTFPACRDGAAVQGEPSGEYYATGLDVATATPHQVSLFCDDIVR